MLAALGFATIAVFLTAIMTKRVSVLVALVLIPVFFGLLAGAGPDLGKMMLDGIARVAPVGVMIIFAVLYFGLMLDVGLFDPMITRLLRLVKGDPVKVALATAVLTMAVSLDGDGATTFLITVSAMLPLYQRLGMSRLVLSGIVALGAGVMNIIPWGGPDRPRHGGAQGGRLRHLQPRRARHDRRHCLGAVRGVHAGPAGEAAPCALPCRSCDHFAGSRQRRCRRCPARHRIQRICRRG